MSLAPQQKLAELCATLGRADESSLPVPNGAWRRIEDYHALYCGVPDDLDRRERERFMLGTFLDRTSLQMEADHLDQVFAMDDNVYEIYDFNLAQLYRSASFLRFKTYPLVTLMTKGNFELYGGETEYLPSIAADVEFLKQDPRPFHFNHPRHRVWERFGERKTGHHWRMKLGLCAPVFSPYVVGPSAFLVTHKTEQVFSSPYIGTDLRLVR